MDSKADQRRLTVKALGSRGLPTLKLPNQRCQAQRFEIADFLFGRALNELKNRKISLHLLDVGGDALANGHARILFTILSAVSEAERERVRERVLDVNGYEAR